MRVVNSLLLKDNQILLLFKPSRQKWFLPGGKAEFSENVIQTGCREFVEETGLLLLNATLGAVTTIVVDDELEKKEWMLYTIKSQGATGNLMYETREGILQWHHVDELETLPMFEGDRHIIKHLVKYDEPIVTTQFYTKDYDLIQLVTTS
ncbi:MAG: NUDIX domain-containing protein [Turicibacter sp.]